MQSSLSILMVAAENDAFPKAKVGGIGDVLRDVPPALANLGHQVDVVIPSYGYLHSLPGATLAGKYPVEFSGRVESVALYRIPHSALKTQGASEQQALLSHWVIEHPNLYPCGVGRIYCDDGDDRPFSSDASKYAFFCVAVAQAIINEMFGHVSVLHLHDWHAATLAVLREFDPHFRGLKNIHTVYTIHNLALQGVRPFRGDPSSFQTWFPKLRYDQMVICDPNVSHCYNPMRAAINLSDKVHAVSPTYALEIQSPSDYEHCVYGGEGLEVDINSVFKKGNLVGILNGCEYPEQANYTKSSKATLINLINQVLIEWIADTSVLPSAHWLAMQRLTVWAKKREKGILLTSVGRVTEQKVRLLKMTVSYKGQRCSVLEHLMMALGKDGTFVMVGSGNAVFEQFFVSVSGRFDNLIFLNGYSESIATALYNSGDLFLMPSSFEPCGISQMLAMRAGQACLVHAVGGLNDTVKDGETGYTFAGGDGEQQSYAFVEKFASVLDRYKKDKTAFDAIAKSAKAERFTWQAAASQYVTDLYRA